MENTEEKREKKENFLIKHLPTITLVTLPILLVSLGYLWYNSYQYKQEVYNPHPEEKEARIKRFIQAPIRGRGKEWKPKETPGKSLFTQKIHPLAAKRSAFRWLLPV